MDHHIDRLLAGLLSNSSEFTVISLHFLFGIKNDFMDQALGLCFKGILNEGDMHHDGI